MTNFVHHGMIYVPLGYTSPLLFNLEEVHGGSPWGAGDLKAPHCISVFLDMVALSVFLDMVALMALLSCAPVLVATRSSA